VVEYFCCCCTKLSLKQLQFNTQCKSAATGLCVTLVAVLVGIIDLVLCCCASQGGALCCASLTAAAVAPRVALSRGAQLVVLGPAQLTAAASPAASHLLLLLPLFALCY
jgi:hypothetical protein